MSGEIDRRLEAKLGFDRVREMIAARTMTAYADNRVRTETFSAKPEEIRRRLQLTDEMRLVVMFEENFPMAGYIDCRDFLEPLEATTGASIDLLSLGKLKTLLETVRKITAFFAGIKDGVYPNLKHAAAHLVYFSEVNRRIDTILDRYGEVKDTASDDLYKIRREIRETEGAISRRIGQILKKAQQDGIADADAGVSVRDGKMLIPVISAHKKRIAGFVYDESSSGKTTFIEPAEIVQLQNDLSELRFAETREIARILRVFTEFLRPYVPDLLVGADFVGEIDFLLAKAQTALDMIAGMPVISSDGTVRIRKARHPLLERALRKEGKEIVPLTVELSSDRHILLISGPNAGGKSVCLKTVGLLQYMFQWGMLVPTSETSELMVYDRLMVSIGDDQSLENDLSTYSSFLTDMRSMLSVADERTLVLIDEFGSGTEPAAGGAIAEAILAELDRRGVYGVITTHYSNLKFYAAGGQTGVVNGAMLFDAANITPLFQLEIGLPGNSFAFELARKMGLPEAIVHDAEERAGEGFVSVERNLRKIARGRRALDEKLQRVKVADKTLETITDKYQKELEDLRSQRKDILEGAKREAEDIIKGANRQVEKTIRTIKESQAEKAATMEARKGLQDFIQALGETKRQQEKSREAYLDDKLKKLEEHKARQQEKRLRRVPKEERAAAQEKVSETHRLEQFRTSPLKVGEKVRIKDNGLVGEVSKVSPKAVTIIVGNVQTKLPQDRVEKITANEFRAAEKKSAPSRVPLQRIDSSLRERKLKFSPELDVRGQRVSEALENVVRYLDDALMLSVSSVRILHGKGTGALREEIQRYARTVPGVSSVTDEDIRFGGSGVTVILFD